MTGYFKLIDKHRTDGRVDIFEAPRGSQVVFHKIQGIVGDKLHTNGIPLSLEVDGWADDSAFPGEIFETEDFVLESLSEEEYLEYAE